MSTWPHTWDDPKLEREYLDTHRWCTGCYSWPCICDQMTRAAVGNNTADEPVGGAAGSVPPPPKENP